MTQEEAIKYLQQIYPNGGHCWLDSQRIEAIEMAIMALSNPSLPSNLDEAAEDSWAVYEYRESPRGLYSTCYVDGFKAGAEWMAGQGVAKEAVVGIATEVVSINFSPQALNELDLCPGDKVVIQIRKK